MTKKNTTGISRRNFLQGSTLLAGSILTANVFSQETKKTSLDDVIKELSLNSNVTKLGRQFLKSNKISHTQNNYQNLYKELQKTLNTNHFDPKIKAKIEAQIALDFETDQIVVISDWWLADTEIKLCAITALS